MTPFSFEWQWNIEYAIFMGLLYLALTVIGCGLVFTYVKTWLGTTSDQDPGAAPDDIAYRSHYSTY